MIHTRLHLVLVNIGINPEFRPCDVASSSIKYESGDVIVLAPWTGQKKTRRYCRQAVASQITKLYLRKLENDVLETVVLEQSKEEMSQNNNYFTLRLLRYPEDKSLSFRIH